MSFGNAFTEAAEQLPQMFLEGLLRGKLKDAGVSAYRAGAKALAHHLFHKKDEEFHWDDYPENPDLEVSLEIDDSDIQSLEKIADNFEGSLDKIAADLMASTSERMLDRYRRDWHKHRRYEDRFISNFKNNLENRWGKPLDDLRLLLDLCKDEGTKFLGSGLIN